MMPEILKILFVINPGSGAQGHEKTEKIIRDFFEALPHETSFFELTGGNDEAGLKEAIDKFKPDRMVAVGGDGTVSFVGKVLIDTNIPLGILPGGSANGMAKELEIPTDLTRALDIVVTGRIQPCDTIRINENDMVFHLADLGLNALIIKYFDETKLRGMWTYTRMLVKALLNKSLMKVRLKTDDTDQVISAYMIVIGNASKYGTGAVINPDATTDDGIFELIVVKRIALSEFIKLFWSYRSFNPTKVEIFETTQAVITSRKHVRFQIDGEYKGKLKKITASIVPGALKVLVPQEVREND